MLVTESDGQVNWPSECGLYFRDTRVISVWAIYASGTPWNLLNGGAVANLASWCAKAWASGAFLALLQASLGIEQDPFANVIRFRNPTLPSFLDSVVLRSLKAGTCSVDLSVRRHGDDKISLQILAARGDIEVTASFSGRSCNLIS